MLNYRLICTLVCSTALLGACTEVVATPADSDDGTGTSTGTNTGTGEAMLPATSGIATTNVQPGSSSGSEDSSSSGSPPTGVMISGTVVDFTGNTLIADRQLSIYGMPGLEQTSSMNGGYAIGPVPIMSDIAVIVAGSPVMPAYMGSVIPVRTLTNDLNGVDLPQVAQFVIDLQLETLNLKTQKADLLSQAVVIAVVDQNSTAAVAAGGVTITMDPPPLPGTFYATYPGPNLVLNNSTISDVAYPTAVFFNLPETDPAEISITASHDSWTCTVNTPIWPTVAAHTTIVSVSCEQ